MSQRDAELQRIQTIVENYNRDVPYAAQTIAAQGADAKALNFEVARTLGETLTRLQNSTATMTDSVVQDMYTTLIMKSESAMEQLEQARMEPRLKKNEKQALDQGRRINEIEAKMKSVSERVMIVKKASEELQVRVGDQLEKNDRELEKMTHEMDEFVQWRTDLDAPALKRLANQTAEDLVKLQEKVVQNERDLRRGYTVMIEDCTRTIKLDQKAFDEKNTCMLRNEIKAIDTHNKSQYAWSIPGRAFQHLNGSDEITSEPFYLVGLKDATLGLMIGKEVITYERNLQNNQREKVIKRNLGVYCSIPVPDCLDTSMTRIRLTLKINAASKMFYLTEKTGLATVGEKDDEGNVKAPGGTGKVGERHFTA